MLREYLRTITPFCKFLSLVRSPKHSPIIITPVWERGFPEKFCFFGPKEYFWRKFFLISCIMMVKNFNDIIFKPTCDFLALSVLL